MESLPLELLKNAGGDALTITLLWFLVRDLRNRFIELEKALRNVPQQIADMKERRQEDRDEQRRIDDQLNAKVALHDSEFKAVWRLLGNRPEDRQAPT